MRTIDLHGRNDPWLVMVHGFTQDSRYFSAQLADFQDDFRIALIDLRGHGQAAQLPGPYGIEEYADDIAVALDRAGIERAHYWGTHTGAAVGLILALRQPERLVSLVLEGPSLPGSAMPKVAELIERARSIAHSRGLAEAREDWFYRADWFAHMRQYPERCRAEAHRAMIREFAGNPWLSEQVARPVTPVAEHLAEIRQPVLVYNGDSDLDEFKQAAARLEAGLAQVHRQEIAQAGGFPAWESPETVNALVGDFLAGGIRCSPA